MLGVSIRDLFIDGLNIHGTCMVDCKNSERDYIPCLRTVQLLCNHYISNPDFKKCSNLTLPCTALQRACNISNLKYPNSVQ